MTLSYHGGNIIRGTAADRTGGTWTNLQAGYLFIESDTQLIYYWNGTAWSQAGGGTPQEFGSYLIYIAGSNKKRMNLATKTVEDTNTDASTVIQATIDALGNTSGKCIFINAGFYSLTSTLNFSAINGYCTIKAESVEGVTQLRPATDIPAMTIANKALITLDGLYFSHNQAGYTSSLLEVTNGSGRNNFNHLSFYDFGMNVGTAYKLDSTSGNLYKNNMNDCHIDGFGIQIQANIPNATFWINSNNFRNCRFWNFNINVLKVTSVASGAFDSNNFTQCMAQTRTASSGTAFDYNTAHVGHSFYTTHSDVMVWDLPAASNYADVNNGTYLNLLGCTPDYKIGGAGVGNGRQMRMSLYSIQQGQATFSGNASTTAFTVTHSVVTTPTHIIITPSTSDAAGVYYISSITSTQFTITYLQAPPSGTNNVKFYWRASVI